MQSIFRLPWCSDPHAPKMIDSAGLDKMRPAPMVEMPVLNKLKRKRTISSDVTPQRAPDNKKLRPSDHDSQLQHPAPVQGTVQATTPAMPQLPQASTIAGNDLREIDGAATSSDNALVLEFSSSGTACKDLPHMATDSTDSKMLDTRVASDTHATPDLSSLQQVIENEFNMQILMKHNELRLIEQELAKCQIALEQLRRCELRPFPGSDHPSQAVSSGTGPAIFPRNGLSHPPHPAPHGVTDGPYSKPYRNWLLHDPQFDAVPLHSLHAEGASRPTRNSGSARRSVGQPFNFPGRPAEKVPSMPNYPAPPPKERNQPNVLRRSTDGQLVKLICNNCERGNFSSIQGFLNHCRIAHKVDYKSHDAAAIDCGRPLDEAEAANLPAQPQPAPAHKPTPARASSTSAAAPSGARNLVHPYNSATGAHLAISRPKASPVSRKPVRDLNTLPTVATQLAFTPAAQLPRLSAHFSKHHLGGDLAKAAADARQKIDLTADEEYLSPETSAQNSPVTTASKGRNVSGESSSSYGSLPRPSSRKGFRQPYQPSAVRPSPLAPMSGGSTMMGAELGEAPESPHAHDLSPDLSPHTADSNPGLVSDHEDDDSESEDHPLPRSHAHPVRQLPVSEHRSTCADNMDIDVAVEEIDGDGLIIRRNSISTDDHLQGVGVSFGAARK